MIWFFVQHIRDDLYKIGLHKTRPEFINGSTKNFCYPFDHFNAHYLLETVQMFMAGHRDNGSLYYYRFNYKDLLNVKRQVLMQKRIWCTV